MKHHTVTQYNTKEMLNNDGYNLHDQDRSNHNLRDQKSQISIHVQNKTAISLTCPKVYIIEPVVFYLWRENVLFIVFVEIFPYNEIGENRFPLSA